MNCYQRRGAIRDVGRVLGWKTEQVSAMLCERADKGGGVLFRLAERLVGVPRHLGIHCGGIVITPGPVRSLAPLERATKGVVVTQYEKRAAEALGLIKIDLLGNRSLSTVDEALRFIGKGLQGERDKGVGGVEIDLIDRADVKAGAMMSAGDSLGCVSV